MGSVYITFKVIFNNNNRILHCFYSCSFMLSKIYFLVIFCTRIMQIFTLYVILFMQTIVFCLDFV